MRWVDLTSNTKTLSSFAGFVYISYILNLYSTSYIRVYFACCVEHITVTTRSVETLRHVGLRPILQGTDLNLSLAFTDSIIRLLLRFAFFEPKISPFNNSPIGQVVTV